MPTPRMTLLLHSPGEVVEFDADPLQGSWTETHYLQLSEATNRLLELADGRIEVLPVPTDEHQALLKWLLFRLVAAIEAAGGIVQFAPLRLRVAPGRFREPDLLALLDAADPRRQNAAWTGADLVVEILSADDPERDTVVKRAEYAAAGIREYWLVDPFGRTVTVLQLEGAAYRERGRAGRSALAHSALVPGLTIDVSALFSAATRPTA